MIPLLLVRLRELRYAFYAQDVEEVFLCPELSEYHSGLDIVDGLFRLGGDWVPVVSLATLLNDDPMDLGLYDVLLLLRTDPRMAVRVSSIDGLKSFDWSELKPLDSPGDGGNSAAARLEVDSEPVMLLVAADLTVEKERQLLNAVGLKMAERERLVERSLARLESEQAG